MQTCRSAIFENNLKNVCKYFNIYIFLKHILNIWHLWTSGLGLSVSEAHSNFPNIRLWLLLWLLTQICTWRKPIHKWLILFKQKQLLLCLNKMLCNSTVGITLRSILAYSNTYYTICYYTFNVLTFTSMLHKSDWGRTSREHNFMIKSRLHYSRASQSAAQEPKCTRLYNSQGRGEGPVHSRKQNFTL